MRTVNQLKKIAMSVQLDDPVLLIGETGVGKTSLVRCLAAMTRHNFRRFNLSGQTDKTVMTQTALLADAWNGTR